MKDLLKLAACWLAFVAALLLTGIVTNALHFTPLSSPDTVTPLATQFLLQLVAGVVLVLGLCPLARGLARCSLHRPRRIPICRARHQRCHRRQILHTLLRRQTARRHYQLPAARYFGRRRAGFALRQTLIVGVIAPSQPRCLGRPRSRRLVELAPGLSHLWHVCRSHRSSLLQRGNRRPQAAAFGYGSRGATPAQRNLPRRVVALHCPLERLSAQPLVRAGAHARGCRGNLRHGRCHILSHSDARRSQP